MKNLISLFLFLSCFTSISQNIEVIPQTGHSESILHICFSGDNTLLASIDKNNYLIVWNLSLKKQYISYQLNQNIAVKDIFFSPDNAKVYLLIYKQKYASLQLENLKLNLQENNVDEKLRKKTADISIDNYLLKRKTKYRKVSNNIENKFTSFAVSEKHNLLVAGNEDAKIYVYQYSNGKKVNLFCDHWASVRDVAISHDENFIASASDDRSIVVRTTNDFNIYCRLFTRVYRLSAIDFTDDGGFLATGDEAGNISVLNIQTGQFKVQNLALHKAKITDMEFSSDSKYLFATSNDLSASIIQLSNASQIKNMYYHSKFMKSIDLNNPYSILMQLLGTRDRNSFNYELTSLSISPDSRLFAFSGTTNGYFLKDKIHIFNMETGRTTKILLANQQIPTISDLHFADNKTLLGRENNQNCHIWEIGLLSLPFYVKSINPNTNNLSGILKDNDKNPFTYYSEINNNTLNFLSYHKNEKSILEVKNNNAWITSASSLNHTLKGHSEQITDIDLFPDKNLVVTASSDASLKFWNKNNGNLVATLYIIDNEYSIILTPDNYYLTQKGGLEGIAFKSGNYLYLPEQFDLKYNRPDLVLKKLGIVDDKLIEVYHKAYLKRLKKMNFTEEMLGKDFHLPQIKIIDKNKIPMKISSNKIQFKIDASDSKYKLDRINVWINNVAIYGISGIDLRAKNVSSIIENINIELTGGKNIIQISVMNQKGSESIRESFEIFCDISSEKPVLYVVALGASLYNDSRFNLNYAAKDAIDICNLFKTNNELFKEVKIKTLTNEQISKNSLKDIREFLMQANINDMVVVFIAGHGLLDQNLDYFYATYDIDFENPSMKGISYDDIEKLLDGLKALKKLLFMDTCHSGEIDKDEVEKTNEKQDHQNNIIFRNVGTAVRNKEAAGLYNTSELMKEMFTDLRKGTGANVISSSGAAEFSMESSDWKNGLFTYVLLNGIKNKQADLNNDDKIYISELQNYVTQKVTELSNGKQIPNTRAENLGFDYRIW